jgi:hypothetical protein
VAIVLESALPKSQSGNLRFERSSQHPDGLEVLMAGFTEFMINEKVQTFWAALQRGEFITDAAAEAGTYRKKGARWMAATGGVRPRRGRDLQGRYLSFAERKRSRGATFKHLIE